MSNEIKQSFRYEDVATIKDFELRVPMYVEGFWGIKKDVGKIIILGNFVHHKDGTIDLILTNGGMR